MAEKNRPGDDVPGDDEILADAAAGGVPDDEDASVTRGGGTAVAERNADSEAEKAKGKKSGRRVGGFFREVVSELRKVIWPTRRELLTYTSVVLVFVLVMTLIVSLFDFAFGQAVLKVFGNG